MNEHLADEVPRANLPGDVVSDVERELVRRLRSGRAALPVLPTVAQAALKLANDPNASVHHLARIVDTDPPIAARFMAVANMVPAWRGMMASSTSGAIVRLGLSNTRDLLFQVVYASAAGGVKRYQTAVHGSFHRSVETAVAARTAAQELRVPTEFDYMCGLLHDIGEARVYRILDALPLGPSDSEDVPRLVRKYHCFAGAEVAMAWNLPSEIVDACAAHHEPTSASSPVVRLVMVADAVIDAIDAEARGEALDDQRFARLGVDADAARRILEKTRLGIGIDDPPGA